MNQHVISVLIIIGFFVILGVSIYFIGKLPKAKVREVVEPNLIEFDDLPSGVAVVLAWSDPDVEMEYHQFLKRQVRNSMPVLGRALDRMVEENS